MTHATVIKRSRHVKHGPRPVGREVAALAVHVQEFDSWPFEDEHASSMLLGTPRVIEVKRGENN
jgi:hypothetical protein